MDIVEQVNQYLLDVEKFSNEFLPLQDTLTPIKEDLNSALNELKEKSQNSTEISDKVFYLNRYTDLVKKVESIFEARSKRLQQSLQTLAKLTPVTGNKPVTDTDDENNETNLTPEQYAKIFAILNNK
nr:MAG TPA: hypothetical protein [Caudoviricetes sp.]